MSFSAAAPAQVLARPGWAGSGMLPATWWRTAVFYRLDPSRFQDSGSSGTGDLPGLAQRLPYLRGLGIDALVLDGSFDPGALGDLIRTASQDQLRVVLTVSPALQAGSRQALLSTAHGWLGMGAAGVFVPEPASGSSGGTATDDLVASLRILLRSFPGDRVLLADIPSLANSASPQRVSSARRSGAGLFGGGQDGLLLTVAVLPTEGANAADLREALTAVASADLPGAVPLVRFAQDPRTGSANAAVFAAMLLACRGDALLDFGDEIGLDAYSAASGSGSRSLLPAMQWTPANVQQAAAPIERPATTPGLTQFGPYRPYVRPPPASLTGTAPGLPSASVDAALPPELPAPNTLPGFTGGTLPVAPLDGARINVATEERDPNSLLNGYRELIALHNGKLALGTQIVLNRDTQDAVVWVRRAPAGQRSASDVVAAANMGDRPITLSLDSDLAQARVRSGMLRPLFTFSPTALTAESTGALMLPPHSVFIGEVRR